MPNEPAIKGLYAKVSAAARIFSGTISLENVNLVLYDMFWLSKENTAPELVLRELTRTRRIENSADALRYGTTGNVEKNKKRFLNKFNRVP
ncbi:hypothetical protein A7X67_09255 [Clostridium sp. W14A]|nr:hypothetical protein A7X67_09255 [Clostridium sp. W14A]